MIKVFTIKKIAYTAVCTSLVCIATAYIKIPNITFDGFINLGDLFVIISGIYFGPVVGMIAGGIGSMLGDILAGYPYWAPFTLIIKLLMGFSAGIIGNRAFKDIALNNEKNKKNIMLIILAIFVTEILMITLYFFSKWMMYGFNFFGKTAKDNQTPLLIAALSIKENVFQALGAILISIPLIFIKQFQKVGKMYYQTDNKESDCE